MKKLLIYSYSKMNLDVVAKFALRLSDILETEIGNK